MSIFDQLDKIIKSTSVNESESHDEYYDIDPEYETSEQGVKAAIEQIKKLLDASESIPDGGGGGKSELRETDNPLDDVIKTGSGGKDKTFKSSELEDMDDLESLEGETEDDDTLEEDDFEFDDFDYDSKPSSGGDGGDEDDEATGTDGGGASSGDDEYEDGDFGDDDLGDEDDYDFGDGDSGDGDFGDEGDGESDGESGGESGGGSGKSSGSSGGSKGSHKGGGTGGTGEMSSGSGGSSGSEDSGDDMDYDDTLDYDAEDYDSLESEINDALDRAREGSSSKSEKSTLDKMKESFGDKEDGKSSTEKAEDLSKEINDATSEDHSGSGELAGESLDSTPDDKSFEDDMKKGGFDDKDIDKMKKSKDTDTSSEIDEDRVAKEAMEEMDKKAKERGESTSSLSRSIMKHVLKGKVTNMEWKEMVGVFLKSKSKTGGGSFSKGRRTTWGDKKHLWRDAIMPTSKPEKGDLDEINCFIDFSGSVSQPLVFSFLQRVLSLCSKLSFGTVKVYGFGERLSKPFEIKKRDLKGGEEEQEKYLKEMWSFIDSQALGGSIENFEAVAQEILVLKRKRHDAPIMIFGDGLWGVSYPNPKPPAYLKDLCKRYLGDILALVYYENDENYLDYLIRPEIAYLRDIVGLKHVVTTKIEELK